MRILFLIIFTLACLGNVVAQALDISSGGNPTITGSLGGSVSGGSTIQSDLAFTVNFGEISPVNTNNVVKVTLPVGIRTTQPYQITATLTGPVSGNPQALSTSDVGFGVLNMRDMGPQASNCVSPHIFNPAFNADPTVGMFLAANGRVGYLSSLSGVTTSTLILKGPRATHNNNPNRQGNDGKIFDVVLAVAPQYYAAGSQTWTIVFTISAGPNVPC